MSAYAHNRRAHRRIAVVGPAGLDERPLVEQQAYWCDRLNSALNADQYDFDEVVQCRLHITHVLERRLQAAEHAACAYERQLLRIKNALDAQDQRRLLARAREIEALLAEHEGDTQ